MIKAISYDSRGHIRRAWSGAIDHTADEVAKGLTVSEDLHGRPGRDRVVTEQGGSLSVEPIPTTASLAPAKARARKNLALYAEHLRAHQITLDRGKADEYAAKARWAEGYGAEGSGGGADVPAGLEAEASVRGIGVADLAALILTKRDETADLLLALAAALLEGQHAIEAATDEAGVDAALANARAALGALQTA